MTGPVFHVSIEELRFGWPLPQVSEEYKRLFDRVFNLASIFVVPPRVSSLQVYSIGSPKGSEVLDEGLETLGGWSRAGRWGSKPGNQAGA